MVFFPHEVHKTKKDGIDVFKLALKKAGEKPEHIVFIDDREGYVKTAKKLRMKAVHFKNPRQLSKELKKLGL